MNGQHKAASSPGVYLAPAAPGMVRMIALGPTGDILAVSEFRRGACSVEGEQRRLQLLLELELKLAPPPQPTPHQGIRLVR